MSPSLERQVEVLTAERDSLKEEVAVLKARLVATFPDAARCQMQFRVMMGGYGYVRCDRGAVYACRMEEKAAEMMRCERCREAFPRVSSRPLTPELAEELDQ